MKTLVLLCLYFTLISVSISQSVINRNQLFAAGDEVFVTDALSLPSNVLLSGENVTWDFSAIQYDSSTVAQINFELSETTEHSDLFPNSDLTQIVTFEGIKAYQYMITSNDLIEIAGAVIPGVVTGISTYEDPATLLEFPLAYGDQWEDDFDYDLTFSGLTTYMSEGDTKGLVDGYGTLILPQGTFDDVLRVQAITFTTDTASLGFGLYERSYIYDTLYFWLSPSYQGPLCSYSRSYERSVYSLVETDTVIVEEEIETGESFSFDPLAEPTSASNDISQRKFDLSITPNPFIQNLKVTFNTERPENMQFILQDLRGNLIYQQAVSAQTGANAVAITLPDVPAGAYLAILRTSEGGDTQKLVKVGTK